TTWACTTALSCNRVSEAGIVRCTVIAESTTVFAARPATSGTGSCIGPSPSLCPPSLCPLCLGGSLLNHKDTKDTKGRHCDSPRLVIEERSLLGDPSLGRRASVSRSLLPLHRLG